MQGHFTVTEELIGDISVLKRTLNFFGELSPPDDLPSPFG
jgi:hypothetical protein